MDQEKSKRSQEDMKMSKEVREGPRIKGNKRRRSKNGSIQEERVPHVVICKSMENP